MANKYDDPYSLYELLLNNSDKNFVRRIVAPEAYPVMDLGSGEYATHKMGWGELSPGRYAVFPSIKYEKGELIDYGDKAFDQSIRNNDYMLFDNPEDAEWVSENYKNIWEDRDSKKGLIKEFK